MLIRIVSCGLLLAFSQPGLRAQGASKVTVGWYNGDRQFGIPGVQNWYLSASQLARVYDNFVVPDGGWIVAGVFSNIVPNNTFAATQAAWEIRSYLAADSAGTLVASGVSAATVTFNPALSVYRIEVDGLQVALAPGHYWLNVAPVGPGATEWYVAATLGTNAVGNPPGNDGGALYLSSANNMNFMSMSTSGPAGTSADFSQGVLISGSAGISGSAPPLLSMSDQWRADVTSLVQQMTEFHSLPFPGIGLTDFNSNATDLYNQIPTLSDPVIRTKLEELVASIEDAHTDIGWPFPSPFLQVPLSFYWFDDGIYVTSASAPYQTLLGGKLLSVGQTGIDDATRILTALVPHDNNQWVKHRIPLQELTNADYLFGTGLIAGEDSVPLQVSLPSNSIVSANVQTYANSNEPAQIQVFQGTPPLYQQHPSWNYWATIIDGGATLYFQYNSCMEDPRQASTVFFQQLDQLMAQESVQRIILDMRNNSGGFTSILNPWIDEIQASRFNQPGRLYVIVGRATFSAAMEATNDLHDRTAAIFVGEPTGAKPRFELREGAFALPYLGLQVSYSNGVEAATDPDSTLIPDVPTGLTFQQYMSGIDPALNAILSVAPPQPSGQCAVAVTPDGLDVSAAAATLSVAVQTGSSCPWTVSSLPSWITVSGTASGTGPGTVTLAVAANSGGQQGAILSIGGARLPVTQEGSGSCAYSLNASVQAFPAAGGSGSVAVNTSSGCSWAVLNPLNWVAIADNPSGTETGKVWFTVAKNSGATQWGTLYVAGLPFTIQQNGVPAAGMSLAGSIAQIASAGGWDTSLTLVNLGLTDGEAQLSFFGDDGSTPLLPFTLPQQPALGTVLRAIFDETVGAGGMLVLDTTGASQSSATGSAQLLTSGDFGGFAVLTNTPTGQAAVVPLETRKATSYVLPFDNTGGVSTGVAIANLASAPAKVNVAIRNDTGAQIGTGSINLAAQGHSSFMLTDSTYGFPATAAMRGTVEFDTPKSGQISVLGLRVNSIPNSSGSAFTSLPVLAGVGTGGGAMAHIASGGGWQSTFTLVNTGATAATASLSFFGDDGSALSLPLSFPQTGAASRANNVNQSIPAGGSLMVVVQDSGGAPATGSAMLATTGNVGGFAVLRCNPTGQEAAVPLQAVNAPSYILAFDNTGGLSTGLAVANLAAQAATVNVIVRDDTGAQIGTGSIDLPAQGHTSFVTTDTSSGGWAVTAGVRGTIELDTPSGGRIAPLGLRFAAISGGFALTTIPVMQP
jgi:hypothetical protein